MCNPAAFILGGLGVAQSAVQYVGQSQAASSQAKIQNDQYSKTAEAARRNYFGGLNDLMIRGTQETTAAGRQAEDVQRQGVAAQGALATRAASAGVSGRTIDVLSQEFANIEASNNYAIGQNLGWRKAQIYSEMEALRAGNQNRITSATPGPVQRPSLLAAGLGAAGGVLNAASSGYQMMTPEQQAKSSFNWLFSTT